MTQDRVFLEGEGDAWYARNRMKLVGKDLAKDPVIRVLDLAGVTPRNIIEIGAADGYRLHALYSRFNCPVTAVEPSLDAIREGSRKYPEVKFYQGLATSLPFENEPKFDLVIMYFVFSWIDRSNLLCSAAEIDRVLEDGGYLVIGDFYPSFPQRVKYHHLPGKDVWTYKQKYYEIFLATELYNLAFLLTLDHATERLGAEVNPQERIYVALLRKTLTKSYLSLEFPAGPAPQGKM